MLPLRPHGMGAALALALAAITLAPHGCASAVGRRDPVVPHGVYDTAPRPYATDKLNVHFVPHSHDDVGWKKTVDQYFDGTKDEWLQPGGILTANVGLTLDSVVRALWDNPNRRFIEVEIAFFSRWWRAQPVGSTWYNRTLELVQQGRLEFINGGWCMHDEASPHYIDMIDQTSLGHRFLQREFGVVPRVTWQIDPFGHSSTQASLLGAEAGFDALYFGRCDYQDKLHRQATGTMESVWRASPSLGSEADLFTGVLNWNYNPPPSFNWDVNRMSWGTKNGGQPLPIVDDPRLQEYNVQERVDTFVKAVESTHTAYVSGHLLVPFGSDFAYQSAEVWFQQMDKLVALLNADGRVNALYSTPSTYTDAVYATNRSWTVKTDDWFSYASAPHQFWSGYFTSRPALKGYVRHASNKLQAARQLEALGPQPQARARAAASTRSVSRWLVGTLPSTGTLEQALAVAQHHDAVSGTERQHVADDYARRIAVGETEAEALMASALTTLMTKGGAASKVDLSFCRLANVSLCAATQAAGGASPVAVTLYNAQAQAREEFVRLPVDSTGVAVLDDKGAVVPCQVLAVPPSADPVPPRTPGTAATHSIVFQASLPPVGWATYFLVDATSVVTPMIVKDAQGDTATTAATASAPSVGSSGGTTIDNGVVSLSFDATNQLSNFTNAMDGVFTPMRQGLFAYNSWANFSGPYVFRPTGQTPWAINTSSPTLSVVRGPLVSEARQTFGPWASQVIRLYKGQPFAEVEYTIGPLPFAGAAHANGTEVVSRFVTGVASSDEWYTDSNGREMMARRLNYRPTWKLNQTEPVAGNYFPVGSTIYINDTQSQLSVLTDRSQGGTSLQPGQVELMLHRRCLTDDHKGVGEVLNETACGCWACACGGLVVRATHRVLLNKRTTGNAAARLLAERVYYAPVVLAGALPAGTNATEWAAAHVTRGSLVSGPLPDNVKLMTVQDITDDTTGAESQPAPSPRTLLVRLAHVFAIDEDPVLAKPVNASLTSVVQGSLGTVQNVTELSLTANQPLADMRARRLHFKTGDVDAATATDSPLPPPPSGPGLDVLLRPGEIRTFTLVVGS